jgi:hypothetical protein
MTLTRFTFTSRARPIVELGLGDTRIPTGQALWHQAHWDNDADRWASTEPTWLDVACDVFRWSCEYGRPRSTDRFVPGVATVLVDNTTGWADPVSPDDPAVLTMRPGRAIRLGVEHAVYGTVWLFRGFVDAVTPTYEPSSLGDTVQLSCVDALGEVGRAKATPFPDPVADGEVASSRVARILDRANWPTTKRSIQATALTLIADELGGQTADLLGQAADSAGGAVFGDRAANVAFRPLDWQAYAIGTPPDGTIGNVDPTDVCPTGWRRPFDRADIATRAIFGRDSATAVTVDDHAGQLLYGIEPFERTDLLTKDDTRLTQLAKRTLITRSAKTAPRVRSVSFDAATADSALDLMTTVDVFSPSRYRCRLRYPRGDVFDAEYFATGVSHEVDPDHWTLDLNLDLAAPYRRTAIVAWDRAAWDHLGSTWR